MHQSVLLLLLHCPVVYILKSGQVAKNYVMVYDPASRQCVDVVNYLLVILICVLFNSNDINPVSIPNLQKILVEMQIKQFCS